MKPVHLFNIVALFICIATGVIFAVSYISNSTVRTAVNRQVEKASKTVTAPSPTPFPFINMTVPFLRNRTYRSSLQELTDPVDEGSYTSYLTSYESDGFRVNALLTKPTGEMPSAGFPAIVFVHGYIPPSTYTTRGQAYSAYVDYFARRGFVVLKIDLRGHGESEGEPGGGYFGSDYVVDALNAYSAIQSADFVNKGKVGMWGHSMAGNILMRSFAAKPDIPAMVIWAGAVYSYTDQVKYGIQDNSFRPPAARTRLSNRRRELFEKEGSPSAQSAFWRQVAPVYYLNDLKGAIQIHHAEDDTVVNIGYSRDLVAQLDRTTVPHEYYEYPSGEHNISGDSFTQAMERSVTFFKKYLNVK